MAATGTKEYYQELIVKANNELAVLKNNLVPIKTSYDAWRAFRDKPYVGVVGNVKPASCGRKDGCTADDLASINAAILTYNNQVAAIAAKEAQITGLQINLASAPSTSESIEQQEIINQRKNRTWIPVVIGVVILIIVGIFLYRKYR